MADESYTKCPACGAAITPDEPGAIYAVEQAEIATFGRGRQKIDRFGAYFHRHCSPEALGYVRRRRPES